MVSATDLSVVVAVVHFHPGDQVRLVASCGDVPPGSIGRVLGRFARPMRPSYCVLFDEQPTAVEVAADALELHDS